MCEDYRAGASVDLAQDEADLAAGRRITCPVLAVWGEFYLTGGGSETPLAAWQRSFAPQATGKAVVAGHFVAEENPEAVLDALRPFLA
jgi:haloacetate dehalogenase